MFALETSLGIIIGIIYRKRRYFSMTNYEKSETTVFHFPTIGVALVADTGESYRRRHFREISLSLGGVAKRCWRRRGGKRRRKKGKDRGGRKR